MIDKRGKFKFGKYFFMIVIVIIVILLIIFSFTLKSDRELNSFESFVRDIFVYTEKVITYPFNYINNKTKDYKKLKNTKKDNDILETSIDRIDSIEAENIELRRQIEQMKEELDISYT